METSQTLEQQAQEWLDNREQLSKLSQESGIRFQWKAQAVNPYSLPDPLQSEVLRLLDNPKQD